MSTISPPRLEKQSFTDPEKAWEYLAELYHRNTGFIRGHLAALAKGVDVAVGRRDGVERRPRHRHQVEADPQEVLGHDVQPRVGQEVMDVGDPAGDGVVDRDHREVGLAVLDRCEGVLERRARERLPVGVGLLADQVGVGSRLTLVGDPARGCSHARESVTTGRVRPAVTATRT